MCLVWEPTVNNTVPFGSELAAESQIQRIPFPKGRRRAGPPRRAAEGRGRQGSVLSPVHFTARPGSDPNTLPASPGPALGAGPSAGPGSGRGRREAAELAGRERRAGRAGPRYLSPQLILQLCREAAGGKGRKCPVSPLPKGTLLLRTAFKGALAAGRPAFW